MEHLDHEPTQIRSGHFGDPAATYGYCFERLGEVFIERIIWAELPAPRRLAGVVVADTGYVWYRYWLLPEGQVVERYFTADGVPIGTQIDLCAPIAWDGAGCSALDLLLDIWLDSGGRVTVHNEDCFEKAVIGGALSSAQADLTEAHLRELTAAIARGRFPPPLVRNWQLDLSRIAVIRAANVNRGAGQGG
jgi:predicted RNA-binding protein associated with RNAse of E/G family